jgi:hypothetical protein
MMDYTVKDSSIYTNNSSYSSASALDYSIRVGMVREAVILADKTVQYNVEVTIGNRISPVCCMIMNKFGGVFNYEEYTPQAWGTNFRSSPLPPAANSNFKVKSGDVVLIAYLEGSSRQGVILGGLTHPARKTELDPKKLEYRSVFNGLSTHIRDDGSYKVEFKGKAINAPQLDLPPTGTTMPAPIYDPLKSGSFYGFTNDGSYLFSDGTNYQKLVKSKTSPLLSSKIGGSILQVSGAVGKDEVGIKTTNLAISSSKANITGTLECNVKALKTSIKGTQIAIGNDQFELFDSLYKILDALGKVFLISPTGNTSPVASNPDWVSTVIPLMLKLKAATGKLKDPEAFSAIDPGDVKLESK